MNRRLAALTAAAAVTWLSTAASAQVTLKHKFSEGSQFRMRIETQTNQMLALNGADLPTKVDQFMNVTTKVGKRNADGELRVTHAFDSFQTNMDLPGGLQLQFDSGDPDKKADNPALEPVMHMFRVLAKSKWTDVLNKDNEIEAVERSGKGFDKLAPGMSDMLEVETIKQSRIQELGRLPDDPVKKGDTWKRTETLPLGSGQVMTFEVTYTYHGTVSKEGKTLHQIVGVPNKVTYTMDPASPSPLKVSDSKLKVVDSQTTVFFDSDLGQIVKSTGTTRVTGDMTFDANGQELPGKLDLTFKASMTLEP